MKVIILILLSINSFLFFSQEKSDFKLTFINAYTNKPIENCVVKLYDTLNKFLLEEKSNPDGQVIFSNLKSNDFKIRANSIDEEFIEITRQISFENNITKTFYLYPNEEYEVRILKYEDSLYGNDEVFTFAEEEAKFVGNMSEFIVKNLIYPEENFELGSLGRIYVKFIVELDGSISHVHLIKPSTEYIMFNAEVIRIIRKMPKWIPDKMNGKNVRSWIQLPICINLQ